VNGEDPPLPPVAFEGPEMVKSQADLVSGPARVRSDSQLRSLFGGEPPLIGNLSYMPSGRTSQSGPDSRPCRPGGPQLISIGERRRDRLEGFGGN
jgi:hypothetical protein